MASIAPARSHSAIRGVLTDMKIDPLLEEAFVAACVMTAIGAVIAFFYWVLTDMSPWPYVVLCEVAAFGFGVVLLALSAPKKYR